MKPLTDDAPRQILDIENSLKKKMHVNEFYKKYLSTLYSYHKKEEVNVNVWLTSMNINIYESVDLIDENGNTIIVVPSLLISDNDNILPKEATQSLGDIFHRSEEFDKIIPGSGRGLIQREILDKVNPLTDTRQRYLNAWDKLFTYFGLEPIYHSKEEITQVAEEENNPSAGEPDEFDYL